MVAISESKSDAVSVKKEWSNILNSTPINVVINFAGESAAFCSEVAKELEVRNFMLIYGVDDMSETIKGIEKSGIDGSVVTSFYNYGYEATNCLYNYIVNNKQLSQVVNRCKICINDN